MHRKRYDIVMQTKITAYNMSSRAMYEMLQKKDNENPDPKTKLWDIEFETFRDITKKVNKELNKDFEINKDLYRKRYTNLSIKRLQDLYQKAINAKDIKTALSVQTELSKFLSLGYYLKDVNTINNNISITNPIRFVAVPDDYKAIEDNEN